MHPQTRLQETHRSPRVQTIIVAVPGIGLSLPGSWLSPSNEPWLPAIPSSTAPGLTVFTFRHGLTPSAKLPWKYLLGQGTDLLIEIDRLVSNEKLEHCPIVLIGHSLGGLIVKEALRTAHESGALYKPFLGALASVILAGTPHSTKDDADLWQRAQLIADAANPSWIHRKIESSVVDLLVESSIKFEQAAVSRPVMSIFEGHETKIKNPLQVVVKKTLLVDRDFARTRARNEELVNSNTNHKGLCSFEADEERFACVNKFIDTSLQDARLRIVKGSPTYELPDELESWTIQDHESPPRSPSEQPSQRTNKQSEAITTANTREATAGSSDMGFEFVPPVSDMEPTRTAPRLPCYIIPISKNPEFYGREQVLTLLGDRFFSDSEQRYDSGETRTFAICGAGGMGKTQIAAQFAHSQEAQSFFDAIFWVYGDREAKIADGFGQIATELGLISKDSLDARDPIVVRELVKGWLTNPIKSYSEADETVAKQASWLLIIDNVDQTEVLEDFWPLTGPGCVLFTSRDPLAKNSDFLATDGVDLSPFADEEGAAFLQKLTKRAGDSISVARRLGSLPLAITQMASYIVRHDLTFEEFLKAYDEEENHRELLGTKLNAPGRARIQGYEHTLASVWALESLKHGTELLQVISFLDPDCIQEKIFTTAPKNIGLSGFPHTALSYQKARTELVQSSLVLRDTNTHTLSVHRLIQDATRSKIADEDLRAVFATAVRLVASVWPFEEFGWRHGTSRFYVCEALFPHVLQLRHLGDRYEASLETLMDDVLFSKLLTDAGWYYHESGNSAASKAMFEQVQKIVQTLQRLIRSKDSSVKPSSNDFQGDLSKLAAELHHNLGCICTEVNDPAGALTHFSAFNEMMAAEINEVKARQDKRLSISWNELGNAHMLNQHWREAEECFNASLKTMQAVEGVQKTDMSFPLVNLGLAYWFTARNEQAVSTLSEGLHDRELAFGPNDTQSFITGRFLYALGNVKSSQGLWDTAFDLHRRALEQFRATIGNNHHRTGDINVKVAEHYMRRGDDQQALRHINESLRIFGDRPSLRQEKVRASFKKSRILKNISKVDEANRLWRQCCEQYKEIAIHKAEPSEEDIDNLVAFWSR